MPLFADKKSEETSYAKGVAAETQAAEHLKVKGYDIIETRYKTKFGEIDVIAKQGNLICFVEVKVRAKQADALESVTPRTQKRIENSALFFLSEYPDYMNYDMRFDVITISGDANLVHLDNAWQARS